MRKGNMVKGASKKAVKMAAKAIATKLNISLWYVWAWVLGILAVILLIIVIFGTIITAVKIEEDKQIDGGEGRISFKVGGWLRGVGERGGVEVKEEEGEEEVEGEEKEKDEVREERCLRNRAFSSRTTASLCSRQMSSCL